MKKRLSSITIGIPAYNEEANIGVLIKALLAQKTTNSQITKIIICSDGSDDNTKKIVLGYKDKRIVFVDNKARKGQAFRQNQIIEMTSTDVLVLLNADIQLVGRSFIDNLVKPILSKKADLTSSSLGTTKPTSFLGRVFCMSFQVRNELFDSYQAGSNLYTCHGAARAFSKSFYRNFRFQDSVAEDAYSYLSCISQKYLYKYCPRALALIKWPETILDHYRQSMRFFKSKQVLASRFSQALIATAYFLPRKMVLKQITAFIRKNPLYATTYFVIYIVIALITRINKTKSNNNVWTISKSSKKLI
jgi:biofilm PGA synthesis N-glycosyltransferase PgaC